MLKKELQVPSDEEWHFEITVGKFRDSRSGYSHYLGYGSIDRIPYFEHKDNHLKYFEVYALTTFIETTFSTYDYTEGDNRKIKITSDSGIVWESTTNYNPGIFIKTSKDMFKLRSKVREKIKFRIDPPPQVTSTQKLWNQSKEDSQFSKEDCINVKEGTAIFFSRRSWSLYNWRCKREQCYSGNSLESNCYYPIKKEFFNQNQDSRLERGQSFSWNHNRYRSRQQLFNRCKSIHSIWSRSGIQCNLGKEGYSARNRIRSAPFRAFCLVSKFNSRYQLNNFSLIENPTQRVLA